MSDIFEKRSRFAALHRRDRPFVLANAWDTGSARVLAALGAEAIGTTSAGHAFTLGEPDGVERVSRDETIAHATMLDAATPLPVSADLEHGFGDSPEDVAACVCAAVEAGLAGCSIEDARPRVGDASQDPVYEFDHALARIAAAVREARKAEESGAGPFTLTARADGMAHRAYDADEALRRLKAFAAAGADVLYAPALPDVDALARISRSVDKPINALAAGRFAELSLRDFAQIGVSRISLGSALARATHRALFDAAKAILDDGEFGRLGEAASREETDALLARGRAEVDRSDAK